MKSQEDLNELKQEYESLTAKLKKLSAEELQIVTGGLDIKPTSTKGWFGTATEQNQSAFGNGLNSTENQWKTHNGVDIEP